MGLKEQILAGGNINREEITFTTDGSGIGSVDLGSAYALLSVTVNSPCRLRLYDNSTSRSNGTEASRAFTDKTIPDAISLIGDFNMTSAGTHAIDPMVFGVMTTTTDSTYYRVEPASAIEVKLTRFLLYDKNVTPSVENRRSLALSTNGSLSTNAIATGTFTTNAPSTFLIYKITSSNNCRLRLYRYSSALSNSTEQNRSFASPPDASVGLIVDAEIVGGQVIYLTPKIVAANTQNLAGSSLPTIKSDQTLIDGTAEIYYSIKNTGGAASFNVTLDVLALED